jgi:hypothetical protein
MSINFPRMNVLIPLIKKIVELLASWEHVRSHLRLFCELYYRSNWWMTLFEKARPCVKCTTSGFRKKVISSILILSLLSWGIQLSKYFLCRRKQPKLKWVKQVGTFIGSCVCNVQVLYLLDVCLDSGPQTLQWRPCLVSQLLVMFSSILLDSQVSSISSPVSGNLQFNSSSIQVENPTPPLAPTIPMKI